MYSRREIRLTLATMVMMFAIMVAGAFGDDIYVDDDATGPSYDGTAGAPYKRITDALADTDLTAGDAIHVAPGLYDFDNNGEEFPLVMRDGVSLLGSGHPDTTIDANQTDGVISCNGITDVTIDGFTITNGSGHWVSNWAGYAGGGIYCNDASPTISNCRITGNSADRGGGIYCDDSASPDVSNCVIAENSATGGDIGDGGGGVYSNSASSPSFTDCVIAGNSATGDGDGDDGGGIYCDNASTSVGLTNCLIIDNLCDGNGGGIYCDNASPVITNCTFSGNTATGLGGALFMNSECEPTVVNSIFWGDSPDEIGGDGESSNSIVITYSCIQGDWDGEGNISSPPQFHQIGLENMPYDGYFLYHTSHTGPSPCIDTGEGGPAENPFNDPTTNTEYSTDHRNNSNPLIDINRVDMGYHYKRWGCTYIELVSFEAKPHDGSIILAWETGTEIRNAGFMLFRNVADTSDYLRISNLIGAEGSPAYGASYIFVDMDAAPGVTYNYWLVDIETSGKWTAHGPVSARLPISFKLIELPLGRAAMRLR